MIKRKSKVILIIIFILCIGIYFTDSSNKETIKHKTQNLKIETVNAKKILDNESGFSLYDRDFIIKDKNNCIELGGKYKELETNEKIKEKINPDEDAPFYYYEYENFSITTDGESIDSIELTTPILETSKGIRIGDQISKVFKKYGKVKYEKVSSTTGYYMYLVKGKAITFYVDSKIIYDIEFELI